MSYNDEYNRSGRGGDYGRDEYSSENRRGDGGYGRDEDSYGGGRQGGQSYGRDEYSSEGRQGNEGRHGGGERNDYYGGGRQDDNSGGGNRYGDYPSSSGTAYGGGGAYGGTSDDFSGAMGHAQQHAGSSGDDGLFGQALNRIQGKHQQYQDENIDEEDAVRQHQNFYGGGGGGGANSGSIGSAAAMQALKMFSGGSGGHSGGHSGGAQNQFIGMAMAEASKLFDSQHAAGNTNSGSSKQEAVTNAAEMAMKMYMKSNMAGGGSSGGGGGGLMSLASKFLK